MLPSSNSRNYSQTLQGSQAKGQGYSQHATKMLTSMVVRLGIQPTHSLDVHKVLTMKWHA